ncbi:hypothetical protein DFP73DRAFT_502168 [Morchella snyderi]|nr:hypothetical protein DFP73DRAFT_502168 [Morchella snyderi]
MCFLCPRKGSNPEEQTELPVRVVKPSNSNPVNRVSPPPLRVATPRAASLHSRLETPFGLKVLFSGHNPIVDVIAVHGLDGHREKSWTADNGVFWLRDELCRICTNSRILTWGYDGRTHGSTPLSCQTLYDHAVSLVADLSLERRRTKTNERPIIFLAHSIGGIIVKSALIHSRSTGEGDLEHHKAIELSTYGVLFFGVPHQGTDSFQWKQIFLTAASMLTHTSDVYKNLERDSEWLQQQLTQYTRIAKDFDTCFLYEVYETNHPIFGHKMVVPKASAVVPGTTNAEVIAIHSDHDEMVKFKSAEDDGFRRVAACISLMFEKAPVEIVLKWRRWRRMKDAANDLIQVTYELAFELDYRRNPAFTGRDTVLTTLSDEMLTANLVILYGTGGVGKTQTALEFIYRHQSEYTSVFWVNAATEERTVSGFRSIAKRLIVHHKSAAPASTDYSRIAHLLGMEGAVDDEGRVSLENQHVECIVQAVKRWFTRDDNRSWLLILDNVDDLESFDIGSFIPSPTHGTIIMTSRRRECARFGTGILVDEMPEPEAVLLLLKTAQLKFSPANIDDERAAAKLVQKLGYLPLGIDQAGAYIAARMITIEKYLSLFEASFRSLLSATPPSSVWSYGDRSVFTTWEISFAAIKNENAEAADFLLLCSFLSSERIWEDMLQRGKLLEDDDLKVGAYLRVLFSYSLVHRKGQRGEESFYIHPLVHLWARERLALEECVGKATEATVVVGRALEHPGFRRVAQWQFEERIMEHIDAVRSNMSRYLQPAMERHASTALLWLDSIDWVGEAYRAQGRYTQAEELGLQVLDIRQRLLGNNDPKTLVCMANLVVAYYNQGPLKWKVAEELSLKVVEMMDNILGSSDANTLKATTHLAMIYESQGRWAEAEELGRRVVDRNLNALGPEHRDTLRSMEFLADCYKSHEKPDEAEALETEVMKTRAQIYAREDPQEWEEIRERSATVEGQQRLDDSKGHPDPWPAMTALAATYLEQGRLSEAEDLHLEILTDSRKALGKEHPITVLSMGNLAKTYRAQQRLEDAEELEVQVVEITERINGNEHTDTLDARLNLASTYGCQGRFPEAEALELEVIRRYETLLGHDHQKALTAKYNLATTYRRQGRLHEALDLNMNIIEDSKRKLGDDHSDTLRAMESLAMVYSEQGLWEEAATLQCDILGKRIKKIGKWHPDTLSVSLCLAEAYRKLERWKEAEKLELSVLEAREGLAEMV